MTTEIATRVREREPEPDVDQAHDVGLDRPHYRVIPSDDGGIWRGPTEAAWTTRILRGARPPKQPTALPVEASIPHR
jgi:hypothetical protein